MGLEQLGVESRGALEDALRLQESLRALERLAGRGRQARMIGQRPAQRHEQRGFDSHVQSLQQISYSISGPTQECSMRAHPLVGRRTTPTQETNRVL